MTSQKTYNDRLFKGSFIRSYFHFARFNWVKQTIKRYKLIYSCVIELGCFDGKLLEFLPKFPKYYHGYDANWEGGLEAAINSWKENKNINFSYANDPNYIDNNNYDLGVSIETFEHIPPDLVCPYLMKLSENINGYILITVPNEKGPFFLLKKIIKPADKLSNIKYSIKDIFNIFLGRTNYVERDNHKGFDYDHLIYDVKKFFDIIEISPYPRFPFLPRFLGFGVGILAKTKSKLKK